MKQWTCECGHVVEGKDNNDVIKDAQKHMKEEHPEMKTSAKDIRLDIIDVPMA